LYGLGPATAPEEHTPRPWLAVLLLTLVFCAGYYFLIFNKARVELELETDTRTVLKLYWPNQQGQYSEKKMAQVAIKPGVTHYALWTTDIAHLDHLRLDPSEKPANITIRRIAVQQSGFPLYQLQTQADFAANLPVLAEVASLTPRTEGGLNLVLRSKDSQLKLLLPKLERQIAWADQAIIGLGIVLLALGCSWAARAAGPGLAFVPLLAAVALTLSLVMAAISAYNTHPDESVHIAAGGYYKDHSLPPRVGEPSIAHTYSVYGVSRLHSGEIYYLLVGKFLKLLAPFQLESYLAQRLFNVLLFFGLAMYAIRRASFRPFLLPLLISPQVWYVYSYCNSDALSLTVCLIAAWQLAGQHSALNTLLRDEGEQLGWLRSLGLGLLFGLLLLQKENFYFLYVFFFLYFLWRMWVAPPVWSKHTLARFVALVLTGGLLFTAVRVTDAWVNDFKKGELVLAAREQYADPMYKPSTPLERKHPYLQMRERGKTLRQFIDIDRWGEKSFRTAFGVYGYTQYSAPFAYYDYVRVLGLLLLLTLAVSVLWQGGWPGVLLLGSAGACTLFFLGGLIWHAWTVDFQAQGRYMLPLLPMLAILYYHYQRIVIRPAFYSLFLLLFILSVYNFVIIGLCDIGKAAL
jgi:hypothetical protein